MTIIYLNRGWMLLKDNPRNQNNSFNRAFCHGRAHFKIINQPTTRLLTVQCPLPWDEYKRSNSGKQRHLWFYYILRYLSLSLSLSFFFWSSPPYHWWIPTSSPLSLISINKLVGFITDHKYKDKDVKYWKGYLIHALKTLQVPQH